MPIDFKSCREEIAGALQEFCNRWCKREYVESNALNSGLVQVRVDYQQDSSSQLSRCGGHSLCLNSLDITEICCKTKLLTLDPSRLCPGHIFTDWTPD